MNIDIFLSFLTLPFPLHFFDVTHPREIRIGLSVYRSDLSSQKRNAVRLVQDSMSLHQPRLVDHPAIPSRGFLPFPEIPLSLTIVLCDSS